MRRFAVSYWRGAMHGPSGDPLAPDGYIGTSDRLVEAIADFAVDYADQTEADYKTFLHSRFAPCRPEIAREGYSEAAKGQTDGGDQGSRSQGVSLS